MRRHGATCSHCGLRSRWNRELGASEAEILAHLQESHNLETPLPPEAERMERERQCDFCLEPYVDDCIKCGQDFCNLDVGDIDGLCGGCI